ncbi:MAG: damage endonuclease [Acidobacteriota bacterium]|jgi:putative endonuclease|nr:damage endonuclease [Acidobacteriota bacterium]
MPYLYILRCRDGSLYTGIAKDVDRRLAQHQKGRASRYTRSRLPVALAWSREIRTWGEALREERRIKALRRPQKEALLQGGSPGETTP